MVVTAPPLIAVMPELAFWINEAEATAAAKVVVPVEFKESASSGFIMPTAPVKLMLPEPLLTISAFVPLTVLPNEMALPAELLPNELNVIELPRVTAPV